MRHILVLLLALPLAVFCLCGCKEVKIDSGNLGGVYVGNYGTMVETVTVKSDGTFDQQLTAGDREWHSKGTWKIQPNKLEFFNMYVVFNPAGKLYAEPRLFSNHIATWVNHEGRRRIVFDIDCGYVVDRKDN